MRILIIDPGASTTKIGIWEDNDLKIRQTIRHNRESMSRFERIADQEEMRFSTVEKVLEDKHYLEATFDAVVGRGGLIRPVQGGTYEVDDTMVDELRRGANGEHASNLGALLAHRFARRSGVRAFIVDPVVVDELQPHARLSGMEGIERKSIDIVRITVTIIIVVTKNTFITITIEVIPAIVVGIIRIEV